MKNPLAMQRLKLGLTQEQMAALLKTVQSEVSKVEAGELPPASEIRSWANKYKLTIRKFKAQCEAARWDLPLWKFAVHSPQEIEGIECTKRREASA